MNNITNHAENIICVGDQAAPERKQMWSQEQITG